MLAWADSPTPGIHHCLPLFCLSRRTDIQRPWAPLTSSRTTIQATARLAMPARQGLDLLCVRDTLGLQGYSLLSTRRTPLMRDCFSTNSPATGNHLKQRQRLIFARLLKGI